MTKDDLKLVRALRSGELLTPKQSSALARVIIQAVRADRVSRALHDMAGAADALRTQVEQMRGMFDDDDGTIADACEAHDDALESLERAREPAKPGKPDKPGKPAQLGPIAVVLDGGLVRAVVSHDPAVIGAPILIVDYDVEGADDDEVQAVVQGDGTTADAYVRGDAIEPAGIDLTKLRS